MEFQATEKYIRTSARKLRLVADLIRDLTPTEALSYLDTASRRAARPLYKAVASAVDNAKQKQAEVNKLKFVTIEIMGGGSMKRWRAVSRGQAHGYKKRMTHVRIVLADDKNDLKVNNTKGVRQT
ncbi:hypothetical protein A2154_03215 [Candidatus Gottesmanbacteria bacterium RBG_16_43_7]|uniref:50S ribosomal protein L22 n=1 Tax=Candidatus Gottesmanbacteria bacterium RBG_16_43_7 TaxID=1798373 RepID=A0A1F5ZA21_9BACT|nr:MAG: hypothetical protein A2154_03215 [Candidatus Gottesmanbacteria bacterium RBG_16_43_7]